MNYSLAQLKSLASKDPKELLIIMKTPGVTSRTLSLCIEQLAEENLDEEVVLPIFKSLLRHINSAVRESAIIGISLYYSEKRPPQDILDKLIVMSENDSSNEIKECAQLTIRDFEKLNERNC